MPAPEAVAEQSFRAQKKVAQDAAPAAGVAGEAEAVSRKRASAYLDRSSVVERYAPGTQLQNGPGVPNWNFQTHRLQWSGPVEPSQTMRLVVLTTLWVSVWRIVGIVLVALALYAIVRFGYPSFGVPRLDRWLQDRACDRRNPARGRVVAHGAGDVARRHLRRSCSRS